MSNDGKMGSGATWGIAIAGSAVGAAAGAFLDGWLGWLLALAIIGAAGWACVHMTTAGAGKGILAFLVGSVAAAIVSYLVYKSKIDSAIANVDTSGLKSSGNAQIDAQMKQLGNVTAGAAAAAGAGLVAFFSLLRTFIVGMVGCFIGNATKKSASGGAAAAKAA